MSKADLGNGVTLDVARLIETRMLVQANSGGGKSYLLRKLCEVAYGETQIIIIDVEGEFHSLREKFDYVLAGQKGGDCPADLKSAAMLARRLLELNVSAIIDIYELGAQRGRFVKLFLEAMMAAPRDLWHPVLVVIDEAHMFCPEKDKAESAGAVIDLMTRGRKRGFAGVLATQRIAKLNKDAAAECNNKLIGRCGLDVDMKRAGAELGFSKNADLLSLRSLKPGEFYAFGPALTDAVTTFKVGAVKTSHPKAGQKAAAPTPPRARVKRVLAQLADLPHEAEEEAKTVAELHAQIRELKQQVKLTKLPQTALSKTKVEKVAIFEPAQTKAVDRAAARMTKDVKALNEGIEKLDKLRDRLAQSQQAVVSEVGNFTTIVGIQRGKVAQQTVNNKHAENMLKQTATDLALKRRTDVKIGTQTHPPVKYLTKPRQAPPTQDGDNKLDGPMLRILGALAWFEAMSIEQPNLTAVAFMSGYSGADNGAFNNARGRLRSTGYVDYPGPGLTVLTDAGRAAAPAVNTPKTAEAVRDAVMAKLDGPGRRIMQSLIEAYPNEVMGDDLAVAAGYSGADNGAFNNARGRLRTLGVVTYPRSGATRAADILFPG